MKNSVENRYYIVFIILILLVLGAYLLFMNNSRLRNTITQEAEDVDSALEVEVPY